MVEIDGWWTCGKTRRKPTRTTVSSSRLKCEINGETPVSTSGLSWRFAGGTPAITEDRERETGADLNDSGDAASELEARSEEFEDRS